MRARNIKPGFFSNEQLVECEPMARLLFVGLWCLADRDGRLEDRPKKIKMQIFPADNCDCEKLLQQLANQDLIIRYRVAQDAYIAIPTFSKHQRVHANEAPSSIPPFEQSTTTETTNTCYQGEKHLSPREQPLRPECLNTECLNTEEKHLPSSAPQNSTSETKSKAFSSPTATDGRFAAPRKGKKATTQEWVKALGNGLRSWFEQEWWPEQLRKVGKKECAQAIHALNPDAESRHQILNAYIRQRDSTFSRREIDKVPHPATWINGCRWEDDLTCADPYGIEG